ncbi:BA14K family protein [Szabonella alba]|uniref:Lectin-like protein BA14k n=1 Tax=Szabonella alba TaxID=2804194 RepID=A0A8K0Y193_9RHOB|nr:BA14K family protein [Szabonella alba]MBL4917642.1 BA14K family protein [Szabonella alba]
MKLFTSTLAAVVLSLTPITVAPANAAPVAPLALTGSIGELTLQADLVEVQQRRGYRDNRDRRRFDRRDRGRHGFDNRHRRPPVHHRPRREADRDRGPDLGSALIGAIIGGVLVDQFNRPQPVQVPQGNAGRYLSQNHVNWCHDRWRSYRASDNSYQPYNGPRRVCSSPYGPS